MHVYGIEKIGLSCICVSPSLSLFDCQHSKPETRLVSNTIAHSCASPSSLRPQRASLGLRQWCVRHSTGTLRSVCVCVQHKQQCTEPDLFQTHFWERKGLCSCFFHIVNSRACRHAAHQSCKSGIFFLAPRKHLHRPHTGIRGHTAP